MNPDSAVAIDAESEEQPFRWVPSLPGLLFAYGSVGLTAESGINGTEGSFGGSS